MYVPNCAYLSNKYRKQLSGIKSLLKSSKESKVGFLCIFTVGFLIARRHFSFLEAGFSFFEAQEN